MSRRLAPVALIALVPLVGVLAAFAAAEEKALYLDASKPVEARVEDLLKRLTFDEKLLLVHADSKFTTAAIPRLGIPTRWLSDGPHGVREDIGPHDWKPAGRTDDFATWLPVGVALAATWDPDLAKAYGQTIGEEALARGKHIMLGPAVNIHRTPLCGRNFEYFGEDPFLAARMVVPWIRGMQALKVAACVKHYALNNQEWERGTVDVEVDERALREIYLPAFEAAVKEGGVLTVMGAYNRFRGQHACHNDYLLNQVLKGEWGFKGLVMSDWSGTHDTREAALYGLDLEMGTNKPYEEFYLANPFRKLLEASEVPMSVLDDKARRNLRVMIETGALDGRPLGALNTKAHQQTARKVAEESIVLLKNAGGLLPLAAARIRSVAVIGENATRKHSHEGGSSEIKAFYEVTPLEGILRRAGADVNVIHSTGYVSGTGRAARRGEGPKVDAAALLERAVAAAKEADVAIVVGGLNHDPFMDSEGVDRKDLALPGGQDEVIRRVAEANPRTVVVLVSGGPVDVEPWLAEVPAVVQAWYAGMEGGHAVAAILFGDVNPAGRLPATFPRRLADSPAHALGAYPGESGTVRYEEGLLVGYRWFDAKGIEPLFPFGHGLSYTTFEYANLKVGEPRVAPPAGGKPPMAVVQTDVKNTGSRAGAEVVQVYVSPVRPRLPRPPQELKGFARIDLKPGETKTVAVSLGADAFSFYDPEKKVWVAEAGEFRIRVGSSSRLIRFEAPFTLKASLAVPR
jgi:beta-glucosidase